MIETWHGLNGFKMLADDKEGSEVELRLLSGS